jgi:hypothetical protein
MNMPPKQNPTAEGDRVSWNSLVGASTKFLTHAAYRTQYLIDGNGVCPELAVMLGAVVFRTSGHD